MRKAEEMYNYCVKNGYGKGLTKGWSIKHFKVLEENLISGEEVYMTFIGLKDYVSATKHDGNYAYAITNKRIIFGQKKVLGQNFKSVVLDRLNDISSSTGAIWGKVTIDTLGEVFNVGVDKVSADKISKEAHNVIFNMRNKEVDSISELRKYKDLMDEGIISKEEFESKKKELLA